VVPPEEPPETSPSLLTRLGQLVSFVLGAGTFFAGNVVLIVMAYPTLPNPGPQSDIRLPLFGLVIVVILITFLLGRVGIAFGAGFASCFVFELLFMSGCTTHWADPGGTALHEARVATQVEAAGVEAEARAKRKWQSEVRKNGLDLAIGVHRLELATGCALDHRQKHGEYPAPKDSLPDIRDGCGDLPLRKNDETGWRILYTRIPSRPGDPPNQFRVQAGPDRDLRLKGPLLDLDYRGIIMRRDSASGPAFALGSPLQPIQGVVMDCIRKAAHPKAPHATLTLQDLIFHSSLGCSRVYLQQVKDDGGTVSPDPNLARLYLPTTRAFTDIRVEDMSTAWNLTYVPLGRTPEDGFDLQVRPMMYGFTGVRSYLMTHGQVHATWEDRPATINDPLAEPCEIDPNQPCHD
jgi:hypothetical protein